MLEPASNIPFFVVSHDPQNFISEAVTCGSKLCPKGYKSILNPDTVECENFQWTKGQCCEKVCSSKQCPPKYTAVADYETKVCWENDWTTELCCVKSESLFYILDPSCMLGLRHERALPRRCAKATTVDYILRTGL